MPGLGIFLLLLLGSFTSRAVTPQFSDVFTAGEGGFPSIRIPAVVVATNGSVLAFAEGRSADADQANNKIILKRSADGGRTWGALQIVADAGANCLNNPCAVVDEKTGRVLVMFQEYPAHHSERDGTIKPGLSGPSVVRNFVITSDDNGVTWSPMRDVTATTKNGAPVTIVASGPGIGIQLTRGAHAGRIIIPFNEGPFGHWNVLAVYSDDGGQNWHLGEAAPGCCVTNAAGKVTSLVNEVQMAELSDGSVMLNSRKWGGRALRKIAVSHDGGETWSKIEEDPALNDPGCMASLFRYSFAGDGAKNVLLFSNPDSRGRENGTIRASFDDGKTWPVKKVLWPGGFAYSSLTRLPDGEVGCLFEADNCARLVFARFPLAWLTAPKSAAIALPPLFTDNMVLQRDQPVPVWGTAEPDEKITVEFAGQEKAATADAAGKWQVTLDPLSASAAPRTLTVNDRQFTNVVVGEVWLAAGQSNMEFPLARGEFAAKAIPAATNSLLRLLNFPFAGQYIYGTPFSPGVLARLTPEKFYSGAWQPCSPAAAKPFSAVAYYFGNELAQKLGVPVGIINCAVGGSPTEAWIPRASLADDAALRSIVQGDWLTNPVLGDWCRERGHQNLDQALKTGEAIPGDDLGPNHPFKPAFLWDAGPARFAPYALRGVIWYQGESNSLLERRVRQHELLFPLLVNDWRAAWGRTLPFFYVQLSSIRTNHYQSQFWPQFRDQQRRFLATIPDTGMAVSSDLGAPDNVHYPDKRDVGHRLALWALAKTYGEKVEFSGPLPESVRGDSGPELTVTFSHAEGMKGGNGAALRGFEVAGADGVFHPAQAVVSGEKISVSAADVGHPVAVRYGWQPFSEGNLVNAAGLPASTFEMGDLPGGADPAAKRPVRVACVGDSITFGYGIGDRNATYPADLQRRLGAGYVVRNFGHSGCTVTRDTVSGWPRGYVKQAEFTNSLAFAPDVVVCNLGINDVSTFADAQRKFFVRDYDEIIAAYRALPTKPRILIWQPLAPLFPGQRYYGKPVVTEVNDLIRQVAEQTGVATVDMATPLADHPEWFQRDHLHPNAEGARKIAEAVAARLRQILPAPANAEP